MKRITVFVKKPGEVPSKFTMSNTLGNFQKLVGGKIETLTLPNGFIVVCNEEGRLEGMEENCEVYGVSFAGTVVFCKADGEDFGSVDCTYSDFRRTFPQLFRK